ncbi:MAG: thermosome subunit beta [Candidatus Bathyarchaeia archaeon]
MFDNIHLSFTLKESTTGTSDPDVRLMNISVATTIANILRTSLGPRGLAKLIIRQKKETEIFEADKQKTFVITKDGATILKEMASEHPIAQIIANAATAQDSVAGDGTLTMVVLAGELLKEAGNLINVGVHPTIIASGFSKALKKSIKILENLAFDVKVTDYEYWEKIAKTALESKIDFVNRDHLAEITVEAVKRSLKTVNGRVKVDIDNVEIIKKEGGSLSDTFLCDGVFVDREIVRQDMPKLVENAKIALIYGAIEVKEVKGKDLADMKLSITSPSQIASFLEKEAEIIKKMVEQIRDSGANVVLLNRGINDLAAYYLARLGIPVWNRIFVPDMERIARITGGKVVNIKELSTETLGHAKVVREVIVCGKKFLLIEGGRGHSTATIFVRSGLIYEAEEAERALRDALWAVKNAIEYGKVIVGGGFPEIALSCSLKKLALNIEGLQQMAVDAFADALLIIPHALAKNAGLNPLDALSILKTEYFNGKMYLGIDAAKKNIGNMMDNGVFEPLQVKLQALKSATELAISLLRIDECLLYK